MRELAQEDIDAVFGECVADGVWCLIHHSRITQRGRCDAWRDFEDAVECVIERLLKEEGQR